VRSASRSAALKSCLLPSVCHAHGRRRAELLHGVRLGDNQRRGSQHSACSESPSLALQSGSGSRDGSFSQFKNRAR